MTRLFAGTPFDIPPRCDRCGAEEAQCRCTAKEKAAFEQERHRQAELLPADEQQCRVLLERRKGNRQVTVVDGLRSRATDLGELLSTLQAACGTGGTVKKSEQRIELQGDHVAATRQCLSEIGYQVK